jgi:ABC-2 type transport system permease protein
VIAFILGVGVCCIGLYAGSPAAARFVAGWSPQAGAAMERLSFMQTLSFQSHFESLQRGVLEIKDLGFFLLLLGGGLWANIVLLEERKGA